MADGAFELLRAAFFRWAQRWPVVCAELATAPKVLAVGDLHVENFGTWRDSEGRLVWGVNDFDEAWPLPYTSDLVRLATSAMLAAKEHELFLDAERMCDALLQGYREALEAGGRPFVLAEHHPALREMAAARLKNPEKFWEKLKRLPTFRGAVPGGARKALQRMLPHPSMEIRYVHRIAGLGEQLRIEVPLRQHDRLRAARDRAHQHIHSGDIVRGQGEQPLARPSEHTFGCRSRREQGIRAQRNPLRHSGGPARLHHERHPLRNLSRKRCRRGTSRSLVIGAGAVWCGLPDRPGHPFGSC